MKIVFRIDWDWDSLTECPMWVHTAQALKMFAYHIVHLSIHLESCGQSYGVLAEPLGELYISIHLVSK